MLQIQYNTASHENSLSIIFWIYQGGIASFGGGGGNLHSLTALDKTQHSCDVEVLIFFYVKHS